MFALKMSRKVNLAKIASKNLKNAPSIVETSESALVAQSSTQSPYFSPIAGRTRNNRKNVEHPTIDDIKSKSSGSKLPTSSSEKVIKAEKDLTSEKKNTTRKHVKVEYDEKPADTKIEVKQEATKKQGKKRTSDGGKSADSKNVPTIQIEENSSEDSTVPEKQVKWEPKNWRQLLANIREMRKERNAPVDTMGCNKCYDERSDEKTKRFHHLVALMLSSQTKDAVTYEAMSRLKRHGLTPENMVATSTNELEQLLYPVGFYKTKAKNIQKTAQILVDKYDSDIPDSLKGTQFIEGLCMIITLKWSLHACSSMIVFLELLIFFYLCILI